jgi:uncharacterized membrane protein YdbT with pleckstrin-like domain
MTDIEFDCPHCGNPVLGDDSMLGRAMQCPACHQDVTIPVKNPARAVNSDEELDVFTLMPSSKAFLGELTLGVILLLAYGVGVVLFLDVWVRRRAIQYRLTNQRLFVRTGFIKRKVDELELYRVKDVKVNQSLLQRILGFGSITVLSSDDSTPELTLIGILNPEEVKETIRTCYRAARRREGMSATEFMPS